MFRVRAVQNAVVTATRAAGERASTGVLEPLALVAVVLGVLLRIREFAAVRPVSIDEAAMARTIMAHSWTSLFGPLDFGQIAPAGFLVLQKLALQPGSELSLRIFPFAASLLALPLALLVSRRMSSAPAATAGFILCLSIATPVVAYAATGKPYAYDVAASLAAMLLALEAASVTSVRRAVMLGLGGLALAVCSFTTLFALAPAVVVAVHRAFRRPESRAAHLTCAVVWSVSCAVGYGLAQVSMSDTDASYMQWFWSGGFPPEHATMAGLTRWLWTATASFFGQTLHYRASRVCVLLWFAGCVALVRRRGAEVLLLAGPMMLAVAAALLHRYPFTSGRVELFLVPGALLLVAEGASWLGEQVPRLGAPATLLPIVAVGAIATHAALRTDVPPEIDRPPVRAFLEQVRGAWSPEDRLFVHYTDAQQYLFYAPRFPLPSRSVVVGACSRGVGRPYLRDIATLSGHSRVWVALTHRRDVETSVLRAFLDLQGTRRWPDNETPGTGYGYRYDLGSRPGGAVDAETFPLPAELDHLEPFRWSCYGVFEPHRGDR